jgi:hypothetical protein
MPLHGITTNAATSFTIAIENIRRNIKLGLPRLESLTEFMKVKGRDTPIALVGGGPSVKTQIEEIKKFKTIISCGSANDWCMKNAIHPTYSAICDPDPISINYFQHLNTETKYLLASSVDEKIIKHFSDKQLQLILWHCHSEEYTKCDPPIESNYQAIGGGCTVGLRSLSIAIMMGYQNIHFFGFDSCLEQSNHHVYEFSDTTQEQLGQIFNIQIGGPDGPEDIKTYQAEGYQLAQVDNFKQYYKEHGHFFEPTFHGEGLLPDFWKLMQRMMALEHQKGLN